LWEEWRITDCLREQYSRDFEEKETLRDLKEDEWINCETKTGSSYRKLHNRVLV
jgi:hypothetical protein